MKRNFIKILFSVAICVLIFSASVFAFQEYEVFDLGTLGGSVAYGINDLGQVVGSAGNNAFLWDSVNGMILLDGSMANNSYALDINNSGQIVGSLNEKGVLWKNGTVIDLGTTGVDDSPAVAINNTGQVVGYQHTSSTDSSSPYRAWIWDAVNGIRNIDETGNSYPYDINDAGVVAIGRPAAIWQDGTVTPITHGQAQGINNLNQVVGSDGNHAFLWENGSLTDLGTIGTATSDAKAINEKGQVVGQLTSIQYEHAMFWQDGKMYDLNDFIDSGSDFVLTNAFDINNKGQIVGVGMINGDRHAFVMSPSWDALVTTDLDYYINIKLSDTFSFDYWWEMGQEPEGFNLDILFFSGGEWKTFLGWKLNFNGSSTEWETASFMVPKELRGLETQMRFQVFDFGADTDPTVWLRNIASTTAPVPEPATMLLLASGLVGLVGLRKKFRN